jgi:hypothetical protein
MLPVYGRRMAPTPVDPPARTADLDLFRRHLCALGDALRDEIVAHRAAHGVGGMAAVVGRVEADVIYAIDRVSDERVLAWFAEHWPASEPVRLVMEGIDDHQTVTFPADVELSDVRWICVIDPIDGTRNLMYDKRPAWVLTALAPATFDEHGRPQARFAAIEVAAMTEIPTVKQWRADQVSVVRGAGATGVVAEAVDVISATRAPITLSPTRVTTLEHGFASFAHALPDAKALLAAIDERLWDDLVPPAGEPRQIFEDQYLCSGGQLYEVLSGRDRLVGDVRPLALAHLGLPLSLTGHPYDICTALILTELGGVFEAPSGAPFDCPLDTTTPVTWVAYANEELAALVRPALTRALDAALG